MVTEADRELNVLKILGEALELEGAERRSFLVDACAGDNDLRREMDALLAEEEGLEDDFLESPVVKDLGVGTTLELEKGSEGGSPSPVRLGPYLVVRTLGRGGMGTVYLGEQEEPVRRRVALKVIDGIHDWRRLQRFSAECQAMARLSHPNVASLYEVGTTEEGYPFVALELIEGASINTWCDDHGLGLRQRIELFCEVCAGVRHAHEKGILHRDLKPSNVLVTEVDGRPTAKVIDFGIARALEEPLVDGPQMTQAHQLIGSPAYMSPEAAAGNRDPDTRSDVYSLGLLLYQLLVGVLPYEPDGAPIEKLLLRIAQSEQVVPSVRFAELGLEERRVIAARRSIAIKSLIRRLKGDLDAIAMKAIARRREDRYSSPADLASDLRRHLRGVPVTARPRTTSYVLGRFLRRQTGVVISLVALIAALAGGLVARSREAERANLEAWNVNAQAQRAHAETVRAKQAVVEAEEITRFLVDLFEVADPERSPDDPVDVRQLLDRGAERLRTELEDQPLARGRLLHTIGEIYTRMGQLDRAEELVAEALAIRQQELKQDAVDVLESLDALGIIYRRQERYDEAEVLSRQVLSAREANERSDPLAVARALNTLGNLLWSRRKWEEAESVHLRALEIRENELGEDHQVVADSLNNVGVLLRQQKRYADARLLFQRASEIFAEKVGTKHPRYASVLFNLGLVEVPLGLLSEAESHYREALSIREAVFGNDNPLTSAARSRLERVRRLQTELAEDPDTAQEVL